MAGTPRGADVRQTYFRVRAEPNDVDRLLAKAHGLTIPETLLAIADGEHRCVSRRPRRTSSGHRAPMGARLINPPLSTVHVGKAARVFAYAIALG
jgi:hypothetical protein